MPTAQCVFILKFDFIRTLAILPVLFQHRYYGSSVPFGKAGNVSSLTTGEFKWLTIEQVLADSVAVIR